MSPAEAALAKVLGDRLGAAGRVAAVSLGRGSLRVRVELRGQPAPVEVFAEGACWEPDGDHVVVRWEREGSSLEWADTLLRAEGERAGRRLRLRDGLRLVPLKLLLPRA